MTVNAESFEIPDIFADAITGEEWLDQQAQIVCRGFLTPEKRAENGIKLRMHELARAVDSHSRVSVLTDAEAEFIAHSLLAHVYGQTYDQIDPAVVQEFWDQYHLICFGRLEDY